MAISKSGERASILGLGIAIGGAAGEALSLGQASPGTLPIPPRNYLFGEQTTIFGQLPVTVINYCYPEDTCITHLRVG